MHVSSPQNNINHYQNPKYYSYPPLQPQNPPQNTGTTQKGPVRASFFYFNDYHGCGSKMGELRTAADYFSKSRHGNKTDTFKIAAGDILKGKDKKSNSMWIEFLNKMGMDLSAIGNHELDQGAKSFNDSLNQANYRYISSNININPSGEMADAVQSGKIVKSWIERRNGHLYGFVGLTPSDEKYRKSGKKLNNNNIAAFDTPQSLTELQKEVDKLRSAGVNKIILLSHFDDTDNKIAGNISGIDIIVSGHKHRVYKGIVPNRNLLNSPTGEPVIKVEGGRDGQYTGTLDVIFDKNGIITHANNRLQKTTAIPEDISVIPLKQKYRGQEKSIGILSDSAKPKLFEENPVASFVADAVRKKSGADIVLIPGGSIYEGLERGILTDGDIKRVLPFDGNLYKVTLSEKDIVDALKNGITPSQDDDSETNILQVAGLKYTITPDNRLKNVYFESPDNKLIPLNTNNPDTGKKFTAVYGDYLLQGKNGFSSLKRPETGVMKYNWNKKDAVIEHIKKENFIPFKIQPQGRIINSNPQLLVI